MDQTQEFSEKTRPYTATHNIVKTPVTNYPDSAWEQKGDINALRIILRMAQAVTERISSEEICERIIDIFIEETDFENISILFYNPKKDHLKLVAATGSANILQSLHGRSYHKDLVFERGEGIAWQVFESQTPVFIEDSSKEPIPAKSGSRINLRSLACLPLWSKGVLNLSVPDPRSLPSHQRKELVILSNVIGHLLQTTELHEKLTTSHQHLQQLVDARTGELQHLNREYRAYMVHMESVIEKAPQGICLVDSVGNIQHVNPSLLSILDCSPEYLAGHSPAKIFQYKSDYAELIKILDNGGLARLTDIALLRPDGSAVPADVFLHPLQGSEDKKRGSMLVVHDLTNQKVAAEKLIYIEKLRALGSMAGGIAHDFNNLLTTILGNVELLIMEAKDPEVVCRLKNIEIAVNDGAHTVRRLQTFTGFGHKSETKKRATNVTEVVKDVIELTRPKWKDECQKNGVTIETKPVLQDTEPVAMHPAELREILTNLVFNSVDAMPDGGTLTLRSFRKDSNIIIEVEDTGIGMSEETKKKIFDPYFTTKAVGNSGLGLSVSYGLVVKAGGMISVESKEDKGTTFSISLPISEFKEIDKIFIKEAAQMQPLRVLIVDDEEQIVDLLAIMLDGLGHKVTGLSDGRQALDCLENEDFDLVMTDLGMPGVSGWDIAAKSKDKNADMPVILFTGWGAKYEEKDLTKAGIDAVLSKPFRLGDLMNIISEQCSIKI